jgi:hypothetical protein
MIALAAAAVTITLPGNPTHGLAFDPDGTVLMATVRDQAVRIARYKLTGTTLTQVKVYDPTYTGQLEIMAKRSGFAVCDYETGVLEEFDRAGKTTWKAKVRYPTIVRMDVAGNVWMTFNSGFLYWKTPDSSDPEPKLRPNGEELTLDFAIDLAPISDTEWYVLEEGDFPESPREVYRVNSSGSKVLVGKAPADRMIASKLGGVLLWSRNAIVHVSAGGAIRKLWDAAGQIEGVRYFDRMPDGRLVVAAPTGQNSGKAIILGPEVER